MKRLALAVCSFAVGTVLLSPPVYSSNINQPAGKYERRYWDPSVERQSTEEKGFQHKSPTQRDQDKMAAPRKETKGSLPAGKFERRYWDPSVE